MKPIQRSTSNRFHVIIPPSFRFNFGFRWTFHSAIPSLSLISPLISSHFSRFPSGMIHSFSSLIHFYFTRSSSATFRSLFCFFLGTISNNFSVTLIPIDYMHVSCISFWCITWSAFSSFFVWLLRMFCFCFIDVDWNDYRT